MSWLSGSIMPSLGRRFLHRSLCTCTCTAGSSCIKLHSATSTRSSSSSSWSPITVINQRRFVSDVYSRSLGSSRSSSNDDKNTINKDDHPNDSSTEKELPSQQQKQRGQQQQQQQQQQQVVVVEQPSAGGGWNPNRHSLHPVGEEDGGTTVVDWKKLMGEPLQKPAGALSGADVYSSDDDDDDYDDDVIVDGNSSSVNKNDGPLAPTTIDRKTMKRRRNRNEKERTYIPEVSLYYGEGGRAKKRVLVLCTGGTMTMAPDPNQGGALAPVEGAISRYMRDMDELRSPDMPDYVLHEYTPFRDSSDLGPSDWVTLANDIKANYLHFDGFVVLHGTDTMAYAATALSFMLENLGKPVIFSGSQIPLCEPYNDARRNLIMAMIFASRDTINEVTIFFHDRLLRANRATKVNTHRLRAFDSPNIDPLATIGITIDENEHLALPPPKGVLRVHTRLDTRLLTVRLVPGFDDEMISQMIFANVERQRLRALVLQLYGTGNIPSVKESFIDLLATASSKGILVIAATQCYTGHVMMGHYATGRALEQAGVVSAGDMTVEAIACKCAYLFGRQDLSTKAVGDLMGVPLRGEITPPELLSPPPLSSDYQRAMQKKRRYF